MPLFVKLAKTRIRLDVVVINTGGVLDSGELRESVLHQHMDGFDFCVGREPLFHYAVIKLTAAKSPRVRGSL